MKNLIALFTMIVSINLFGQYDSIAKNGEGFKSVFNSLEKGHFTGTINGLLILESSERRKLVLDFQGSKAELNIEKDLDFVYDASFKKYVGQTTSGKTKIYYQTYADAHSFGIEINETKYELSLIDGACDLVINGLEYLYETESNTEYLILRFSKKIELWENGNINGNKIWVEPMSTLTLAINRIEH